MRQLKAQKAELGVIRAFGERAEEIIGKCPECKCDITGIDLLARIKCKNGHSLASMITPPNPLLSQRDAMLLLGALGAVVAVALIAGRG